MAGATQSTRAFLHAHGLRVEPETLDRLVREALERLPRGLYRDDPRRDLTAAEAEALRDGGFVLDGEDLGEDDPLARTAAEYAALVRSSLTTTAAAARLGVEPSRVRQRLTSLLYQPFPGGRLARLLWGGAAHPEGRREDCPPR